MKKIGKILLFLIIVVGVVGGGGYFGLKYLRDQNREAERIEHIKEDMYLEVVYEDISECKTKFKLNKEEEETTTQCAKTELKVREAPTAASAIIGTAEKGEIYKIVEVEQTDAQFIWFRIVFQKNWKDEYKEGYISQPRSTQVTYVKAYNITFDYANPMLGFTSDEYNVESIDDIGKDGYKHLNVWDDQEGYTITHEVYIEREPTDRPGPQYWVKYTVTDKVGKTTSKIQRVIFKYPPADNKCKDFSKIRN